LAAYIVPALVVVISLVVFIFFRRKIRSQFRVNRDKVAAKTIVEEKFNTMRRDFSEELWHLEKKLKKGKAFSKDEMDRREKLLRELGENAEEIENRVEKI
jgi:flagellar biosynthesis/type III secretory pathway M-ring protein FliF/YscJ